MNIFKKLWGKTPTWKTIDNPNFSIIVPGPCNCNCDFCFWNAEGHNQINPFIYFERLIRVLENLPEQFKMLSLTGGEPTISKHLEEIMYHIDKDKWKKVVLTTNGINLLGLDRELLKTKVDFINISRHHIDDDMNKKVFKGNVPNTKKLQQIIVEMNKVGIPVTLNCVLQEDINVRDFIQYAKDINASNVCFRKVHAHNSDLEPVKQQIELDNLGYEKTGEYFCPVCHTTSYIVDGMDINFKSSVPEPSDLLNEEVYETVLHEDGMLTADWKRTIEIEI